MNWDPTAKVKLEVEIITNLKVLREELRVSQWNLEIENWAFDLRTFFSLNP